jgi:hypothetical protein
VEHEGREVVWLDEHLLASDRVAAKHLDGIEGEEVDCISWCVWDELTILGPGHPCAAIGVEVAKDGLEIALALEWMKSCRGCIGDVLELTTDGCE